jgi:hypothetical protein
MDKAGGCEKFFNIFYLTPFHERIFYFLRNLLSKKTLSIKLTDTFRDISSTFLLLFLTKFPNQVIISDNDVDNAKDEDHNKTNKLLVLGTESWFNQDTVSWTFH